MKGAAADIIIFHGDEVSVGEILAKLNIIFGTVSSFGALMGNFYKMEQGELTVPMLSKWIEGSLSKEM